MAHRFAAQEREAVAFTNAVRSRRYVERWGASSRRGIEVVLRCLGAAAHVRGRSAVWLSHVIAMMQTSAEAYAAAATEAEAVVRERQDVLESATVALADVEQAAAAATDAVVEAEAAERVATDAETHARRATEEAESSLKQAEAAVHQTMMEGEGGGKYGGEDMVETTGLAVAKAEMAREVLSEARADEKMASDAAAAARKRVEETRSEKEASVAPVAAAHDAREEAVRVLLVVEGRRTRSTATVSGRDSDAGRSRERALCQRRARRRGRGGCLRCEQTLIKLRALPPPSPPPSPWKLRNARQRQPHLASAAAATERTGR